MTGVVMNLKTWGNVTVWKVGVRGVGLACESAV